MTIGDQTYPLPQPFLVLATQNPLEQEGTYPLPEAQVDRFMLKAKISYPKKQEERDIVRMNLSGAGMPQVNKVISPEDIIKARKVVEDVYMDEKIEKYIIDIIFATREPAEYNLEKLQPLIAYGGSPRASISLAKAARAYAFIRRRGYVIPEDVRAVCHDVLRHRIGLTYEAEAENITVSTLEVNNEYRRLSQLQDTPEADIRRVLSPDTLAAALVAQKVQRFLLDNADITTVMDPEKE